MRAVFALLTLVTLAACGDSTPPQTFPPLTYDYLTPLRLDVASLDVDDNWVPRGNGKHVENLSPVPPAVAIKRMAQDRLVPSGSTGQLIFVIDDASIVQASNRYDGTFSAHFDVLGDDGASRGSVEVHVRGTHGITGKNDNAVRSDLYALTSKMMDEMNVELEFQTRKTLGSLLQSTSPTAPAPDPVDEQNLAKPKTPPEE